MPAAYREVRGCVSLRGVQQFVKCATALVSTSASPMRSGRKKAPAPSAFLSSPENGRGSNPLPSALSLRGDPATSLQPLIASLYLVYEVHYLCGAHNLSDASCSWSPTPRIHSYQGHCGIAVKLIPKTGQRPSITLRTCPHRLVRPRTPGFHPGNRGSNPRGGTHEPETVQLCAGRSWFRVYPGFAPRRGFPFPPKCAANWRGDWLRKAILG